MQRQPYNRSIVGANYGGGLFSPSTVADEIHTVSTLVAALDRDIQNTKPDDGFLSAWADFVREWTEFVSSHSGVMGYPSLLLNSTYAKVLEYRDRVDGWRKRFQDLGGQASSPQPPATEEMHGKDKGLFSDGPSWSTILLIAGATAGIGWYLSRGRK